MKIHSKNKNRDDKLKSIFRNMRGENKTTKMFESIKKRREIESATTTTTTNQRQRKMM